MGLAAFLISNMSFVTANTPFTSSVEQEIANIRTLVDLAGVVILYATTSSSLSCTPAGSWTPSKISCKTSMCSTASPGNPSTSSTASTTT